jgi:ADP-heptose:LPS heptosyltransferase
MRILATNPDTIGDLVLRQPLYASLAEAGHELMLVVRPLLEPLVSLVAPGATFIPCRPDVYQPRLAVDDPALDELAAAARAFDPDVLVVTPFQWTVLEERLAKELPRARRIAMSGKRFSEPTYGPAAASDLDPQQVVQVAEDAPEVRKNELLAGAILGRAVRLDPPAIEVSAEHMASADMQLARLGLAAGEYWVACVGHNESTRVRNWSVERWAELLSWWAREYGRRFLLVGHRGEREVSEAVRAAMGEQRSAAVAWTGAGDGELDVLLGLIARSAGYVGRDTGPMHLAAAMSKRVLAVFGGGTWPRFVPAAQESVSLTVGVPCAGCNWKCHLPESYCITEVPLDAVKAAATDLESAAVRERTVRVLPASTELLARIGREGADTARQRLVELSVDRRVTMEQTQSMAEALERSARQAGRAEALQQQLEALQAESNRREGILKQRLAAAENLFRTREAEMQRRLEDLESGRVPLPAMQQRIAAMEAEWAGKLAAAQGRSRQVNQEYLKAQAEAADLRVQFERASADQQATMALVRQHEHHIAVLQQRVRDLMASRWRRYGQRLKLCMTMPWESQYQNVKH